MRFVVQNTYGLCKGRLLFAAPFDSKYAGSPHYIIRVDRGSDQPFDIVVNAASTEEGQDGNDDVYCYIDPHFEDPICGELGRLSLGVHMRDFPLLDYWQDRSLLDLRRMRPVPYASGDGSRFDINDDIDDMLTIDERRPSETQPYFNGKQTQDRAFWPPASTDDVIVYGFGFLFPEGTGLHETHMNQGNPKEGRHWRENGTFQDGAVIVQRGDKFAAIFTAFQTQWLPTDARGFPVRGARPLPEFIRDG